MIRIWYAPGTIALASIIALEEVGAEYSPMRLSFADGDQRGEAYLNINPKGRVPAVVTPDGILTETPAVLTWIAETHPAAGLLPADPFRRAQVQETCAYLCSTAHVSHAHMRRGARWSDDPSVVEALKIKAPANMAEHFRYLSGRLRGPWVMGEEYTIADPYLFTIARWLPSDDVPLDSVPIIKAFIERMEQRPAVQRALKVMA